MNKPLALGMQFKGLSYKLAAVKRDKCDKELSRRESVVFPNLFTNQGVDDLITIAPQSILFVGTGNAAPTPSDLYMASYLASRNLGGNYWQRYQHNDLGGNLYEVIDIMTGIFAAGVATGNIAEVGVAWQPIASPASSTPLSSRALVVDGGGNPTTFTVLADEELQLTVFATKHVSYADRVTTVNIAGTDYTVTTRPASLNTQAVVTVTGVALTAGCAVLYGVATLGSPINGNVSSTQGQDNLAQGAFGATAAYVSGSKQRNMTLGIGAGSDKTIGGLALDLGNLGSWQVKFDPPIPKSSLQKFTASFTGYIDNPTS